MVFYWGYLLTQTEKIVYENAKRNNIELDFEDIKDIANDILDDDAFNDDITNHLKNYDKLLEAYKLLEQNKIEEANVLLSQIKENSSLNQIAKNLKHYQGITQ